MRFVFYLLVLVLVGAGNPIFGQRTNKPRKTRKPAAVTMRVMSYNIRYATPRDSSNFWPNRQDKVSGLIRYHAPDILGVQEALHSQILDLEKALPEFTWYGVGRDDGKTKGEFSAVFYRKNRFKLLDKGTFWLSEDPQKPGSKDWDAAITRICTWVKLQDLQTNKTFY